MRIFISLLRKNRGATALEYGLIVSLIFIGMMAGVTFFGQAAIAMFTRISNAISTVI